MIIIGAIEISIGDEGGGLGGDGLKGCYLSEGDGGSDGLNSAARASGEVLSEIGRYTSGDHIGGDDTRTDIGCLWRR